MRRAGWIFAGASLLTASFGMFSSVSAQNAVNVQVGVVQSGYFTRTQDPLKVYGKQIADIVCPLPSPDPRTCLDPSSVTGGTPGWPRKDNYVYVAKFSSDDAYGFVEPDLGAVPFGAEITEIKLTFEIENEPDQGTFQLDPDFRGLFDPNNPHLKICYVAQQWAGADSAPWDFRPDTVCPDGIEIKKTAEKTVTEPDPLTLQNRQRRVVTYTADLAPIAALWAQGFPMHGIAFLPDATTPDLYQAAIRPAFLGDNVMFLKLTYIPGADDFDTEDFDDDPMAIDDFDSFNDGFSFADDPVSIAPTESSPFTLGGEAAETAATAGVTSTPGLAAPKTGDPDGTPWWAWGIFPVGAALAFLIGGGLMSPVTAGAARREGPVSKLMNRRASGV